MSAYRLLLVLGALVAFTACGDSSDTEETQTPGSDEPETTEPAAPPACGDGTVDEGEACDDGQTNCPDGWGLCLRCEFCEGWVIRERSDVPDVEAPPMPAPPYCVETVRDAGEETPASVITRAYDDHGRVLTITEDSDPAVGTIGTAYEYDAGGRRVAIVRTAGERTIANNTYLIMEGRTVSHRQDNGGDGTVDIERRYAYDAVGRLTTIQVRGGQTQRFGYDAMGHLVMHDDGSRTTEIVRDPRGRVMHRSMSRQMSWDYRRDDEGARRVEVAEHGLVAAARPRWNHDYEEGRLVRSVFRSDPDTVEQTCEITTDDRGRVTERACDTDGDGEPNRTTTYSFECIEALRESLPNAGDESANVPPPEEDEDDSEEDDSEEDDSEDDDSEDGDE